MPYDLKFKVLHRYKASAARSGLFITPHGEVRTPVFMPVGTQACVKTLSPQDLVDNGVELVLANTYHLYLRPGHGVVEELGGLHNFMSWPGPILTDSGGFQVFSLGELASVSREGVRFASHIDGSHHFVSPELSIEIQQALGADIIMAFDEPTAFPSTHDLSLCSMERTLDWARRCAEAHKRDDQALFGIVQGGMYKDLRDRCADELVAIGFDGYAVGGLSVGETKAMMFEVLEHTLPLLPEDKPRYLMGVGTPEDLIKCAGLSVDMFDCVLPTRNARNGALYTSQGRIMIKNVKYARDKGPIDPQCSCYCCQNFSRGYLRHLFLADEILALRLNTIHNVHFYMELMEEIRSAIDADGIEELERKWAERLAIL